MKKSRKNNTTILVTHETMKDFFSRGKATAKLLDKKKYIGKSRIISFEDPADLVKFLMCNKLKLVADIRKKPNSVSALAKDLGRSRAAVYKDVQELESIGIVKSEYVDNPGHGKHKIIKAVDEQPIHLHVQAVI